jgi:hypothetical protein
MEITTLELWRLKRVMEWLSAYERSGATYKNRETGIDVTVPHLEGYLHHVADLRKLVGELESR